MPSSSKRIQVVVDQNVHNVLEKMSNSGLRGKTVSEVAYKILDEWIWHNQEKLVENGIVLRPDKQKL